jgi:high-affinity iron transporter
LGVAAGAAVSALMYYGLLAIPAHRLFSVTAGLITLLAAGMAAQAILFLQQGGYFEFLTGTVWNTSWLLKQDSIVGRLLHTLVGYNDSPNGAQLVVYAATVISIMLLTRIERTRHPRRVTARGAA